MSPFAFGTSAVHCRSLLEILIVSAIVHLTRTGLPPEFCPPSRVPDKEPTAGPVSQTGSLGFAHRCGPCPALCGSDAAPRPTAELDVEALAARTLKHAF